MRTLVFDPSARRLEDGRVLLGGHPARRLRLTAAGAALVDGWRAGAPVGEGAGARRLADRLIDAGLAHPRPPLGAIALDDVAVVIPAHGRAEALAACLARVGGCGEIVVVDDGSTDPAAIAAAVAHAAHREVGGAAAGAATRGVTDANGATAQAARREVTGVAAHDEVTEGRPRVRLVRRAVRGGPAAARNTGLAATSRPFVAFLDSDTLPVAGWLEPVLAHFADPRVAAAAPRVRVPAGTSALAAYEAVRSPLDLGSQPGVVGPGRRIGYVPAAALVVRRAALPRDRPFDEAMRFGEDVDLVWRLAAAGWIVRYEPAGVVEHPHRANLRAWLAQRAAYGSSAGPLARRHPGRMRHVIAPRSALLPWALVLAGRPKLALAATVLALLHRPPRTRELAALTLEARARTALQLADAAWRAYAPALMTTRRGRRMLAATLLAGTAADWLERRPALDPVRFGALRAADDLAYASGVWTGCLRARSAAPLIPGLPARARNAEQP